MRFLLLLFLLLSLPVFAQDMFNFLSPTSPSTSIEVEGNYLPSSEVESGQDKTQVIHRAVGLNQKVFEDDKQMISIGAKSSKLDLTSDSKTLRDYYNQQGSVSYKRNTEDNKFWLASFSYGSSSDKPFRNGRDNTVSANYLQKMSEKWFLAGNYSNNRTFLNNVPLPGFFYVKEFDQKKAFIIGFPILYWMRPLGEDWSIRYFGLLPWAHRLKILYTRWMIITPYLGYEQSPQTYYRHDREERYDRFFWFERRLTSGIEGRLTRSFKYDLTTGLAFDRQFYEARNFSQSKESLVNLEKSWFLSLSLRLNF